MEKTRFNEIPTEYQRRQFHLPAGRVIVIFETPYLSFRDALEAAEIKLPPHRSHVQLHSYSVPHAYDYAMENVASAEEVFRDTLECELQVCAPEPDCRQCAISVGGMSLVEGLPWIVMAQMNSERIQSALTTSCFSG
jgi:hypothetical protein